MLFKEIKEKYPQFIFEIEMMNGLLEEHASRHVDKILPSVNSTKRTLGRAGVLFLQMTLTRSQTLLHGFLESLDYYNPLMAFLAARAHYEVTAALVYFLKKLINYYKGEISLEDLQECIYKLGSGSRLPEFKQESESIG
ncbi:MAG: hypothetical protein WD512_02365, partial [Candidatus Paceibacterota bacterium]